jgi:hypothetical protein
VEDCFCCVEGEVEAGSVVEDIVEAAAVVFVVPEESVGSRAVRTDGGQLVGLDPTGMLPILMGGGSMVGGVVGRVEFGIEVPKDEGGGSVEVAADVSV